ASEHDWRFDGGWLAVAVASTAAAYVLGAELWRRLLHALGDDLARAAAGSIYATSLIARYVPTNLLMVVGRVVLAERAGVRKRVCLASLVYEAALGMLTAGLLGAYFFVTLPELRDRDARFALLALVPLAIVALHPRVFKGLADGLLRRFGREPLPAALPWSRVLVFMAGYGLQWAAFGLGAFALASALQPMDAEDLFFVTAAFAVAFCIGVLTFVAPGGLGTREAAFVAVLSPVLPVAAAAAVAVGTRLLQIGVEVGYLVVSLAIQRRAANRSPEAARRTG
ncbi:MAG TPA: lysylphosphatidylglycerol synthase domain-containing protein, partial [Solirubrobacteraceae bacterium]|nr:lysylphosphatidylglycerol synthase domain-containing protein [Solirubrobacteraceae bacterium]